MGKYAIKKFFRTTFHPGRLVLAALLVMAMLFPGSSTAAAADKPMTLRLSNGLAIGTYQNTTLIPDFIKDVKEKTGGELIIDNYPAKSLFGHIATADALHRGAVDMGFVSINHFVGYAPVTAFNDYAFLVSDVAAWKANYDETFKIVDEILTKIGVKVLSFVPYSSTTIISTKLIEKPADCKGKRIRDISDPFFDCIRAWGGVPAAMNPSEAYDAMAKGALDGIMSGWDSVKSRKYYEIADYVAGPTSSSIWAYVINLKTWKKLSPEMQKIVQDAANESSRIGMEGQDKHDAKTIEFLKEKGMTVKVFTPEEKAEWKKTTLPAYDLYVERCAKRNAADVAKKILSIYK